MKDDWRAWDGVGYGDSQGDAQLVARYTHFSVTVAGSVYCIACTRTMPIDYIPRGYGQVISGGTVECHMCGEEIGLPEDGGTAHLNNHLRPGLEDLK